MVPSAQVTLTIKIQNASRKKTITVWQLSGSQASASWQSGTVPLSAADFTEDYQVCIIEQFRHVCLK